MTASVDLNSDLGEGFGRWTLGDDEAMLDLVTSANIAGGVHAGDPSTLRRCCEGAVRRGVAIGAQVGYRDLVGFGRRSIAMDPGELADEVIYQIGALDGLARVSGGRVGYVKPHGALYNATVHHDVQARAVAEAVRAIGVTEPTYYRWRAEYGGLKLDQVKRLKDLETENSRLRRAVSDLTLDKLILKEAARGNF